MLYTVRYGLVMSKHDARFSGRQEQRGGFMHQTPDHPQLGPARPDLAEDCRYFPVGRYLILYRLIPNGIEVVRVVQGSRRLENLFP
jgi:toxin ParE1/3/4